MRILKIELQNINSLKSDAPIVIDFENEHFRDVGLYAITGSTGAGKTTLLDAITIALYNNVPRFNGTKGSLVDIVSHGANDAFSRVTFENNKVVYEAFWGIRIADKSGKKYKTPKEEVSLKDLTNKITLATQKRALITDIIKVTQLDYTQFLRSVMLAQGDFASFLTAKGPDKGKLLEQITGEEVYKKIGQGILDRKSKEEAKLREIQSKINSEDILSDDDKIQLSKKDKELDVEILQIDKEIKANQTIIDWYIQYQKLINEAEKLERDSITIDSFGEKIKEQLTSLDQNEKAEPFKELIQNINRLEEDTVEKTTQLTAIDKKLIQLQPKIDTLNILTKSQTIELEKIEKEFKEWLPKFDLITKIDGQITHEADNKQKSKQKIDEISDKTKTLTDVKSKLSKELVHTESTIKNDEEHINKNSFLKEVGAQMSHWTSALTTLKENKNRLKSELDSITYKNTEIAKTTLRLQKGNKLLNEKTEEVKNINIELSNISEKLMNNDLANLLAKKEAASSTESRWKEFQNISKLVAKEQNERNSLEARQKSYATELDTTKKQLVAIQNQIQNQEVSVADANKILTLERSITNYENDRQNLVAGEPCSLCGSTEHPFVENSPLINISKAELDLNKRTEKLSLLIDSKTELDKKEVKLNAEIHNSTQQIRAITEDLKTLESSANQLHIDCDIDDLNKINTALNSLVKQVEALDENVKLTQQLQKSKNTLSEQLSEENTLLGEYKTGVATLNEKIKHLQSEITETEQEVTKLTKVCSETESDLAEKLSKFNYQLPSVESINSFIHEIEKSISDFNKKEKNLSELKANINLINNKLTNIQEQLATNEKTQKEYNESIVTSNKKSDKLILDRETILPINTSVDEKRQRLQLEQKKFADKMEISKNELQLFLDNQTKQTALKTKINNEIKDLGELLKVLHSDLNTQLKNSDFESRQDIEYAILTTEEKLEFTKNKKQLEDNQLKVKTLKEENSKEIELLNTTKKFEIPKEETQTTLAELKQKKADFTTEKGAIKEALRKDKEIRDRNKETHKKMDTQAEVCSVWKELFKIIGGSQDSFNTYVQRLTLKHLLDLANVHLYNLNKRYSLKMEDTYKEKEELNFNLIDHYQTDQARLVDTSSGGEKFIISLALALGLSDLASKNVKIDSLFIDEGFGTLDSNTLETVISTLETLQSQGKMIGIISHVENLKERIPTQIQITKKNNGVSVVDIV